MNPQLTQQKLYELSKDFLSKSVQLETSDGDTDQSTKGSIISHTFMDSFPELIKKHEKKNGNASGDKRKEKRRSSLTTIPVLEESYKEGDEIPKPKIRNTIPHVKLIKDHQEFSNRLDRLFEKNTGFSKDQKKRTLSVDKLPKVVELSEQEEDQYLDIPSSKIENLVDQNEFNNVSQQNMIRRASQKRISMSLNQQETIQEVNEAESQQDQIRKTNKSVFYVSDQNVNSPRYKLKVDELEYTRESSFSFASKGGDNIETIEEEKYVDQEQTKAEKVFEHSIEKLDKEVNHIMQLGQENNVIQDENKKTDVESMGCIKEIEDSSDEDATITYDIISKSKKRASVPM